MTNDSVIIRAVEITADQIGRALAYGTADEQAEILVAWTNHVASYQALRGASWCMQSRSIAEAMSDGVCSHVASMLGLAMFNGSSRFSSFPSKR